MFDNHVYIHYWGKLCSNSKGGYSMHIILFLFIYREFLESLIIASCVCVKHAPPHINCQYKCWPKNILAIYCIRWFISFIILTCCCQIFRNATTFQKKSKPWSDIQRPNKNRPFVQSKMYTQSSMLCVICSFLQLFTRQMDSCWHDDISRNAWHQH